MDRQYICTLEIVEGNNRGIKKMFSSKIHSNRMDRQYIYTLEIVLENNRGIEKMLAFKNSP
jgi:hypothetical protein